MPRRPSVRVTRLGDAGIRVLAGRGRHALTHRAVDEEADLPPGSTSYYARSREALLCLVVDRIAELDAAADPTAGDATPQPSDAVALADSLAGLVHDLLTRHAARTLARYELTLEAVHRPQLRARLDEAGVRFRDVASALLAAAGSPEPERHGRLLVAVCDGMVFDGLAGAGSVVPPSPARIRADLRDVLVGMLAGV